MVDGIDSKSEATRAISLILRLQAFVSGIIALVVVGGALFMATREGLSTQAFDLLKSWGGIIIGFYFGTAYTQISTLVKALEGRSEKE